jgi:hypothetical protein
VLFRWLFMAQLTFIETIAMGIGLGSIFCTSINQFLVFFRFRSSYLIPLLIISLLFATRRAGLRNLVPTPTLSDLKIIISTPLAIMCGYGNFPRNWWIPFIFLAVAVVASMYDRFSESHRSQALILVGGLALWSAFMQFRPAIPSGGIGVLRPLYAGSDDLIFSESLAWSLSKFGLGEYAAATGTSVRYHWFSLAWSGLLDKSSSAQPFVITLHVIPVISFSAIYWLILAVIRIGGFNQSQGITSAIVLFSTSTFIDPNRFVSVLNTSNIASFTWVLVTICILLGYSRRQIKGTMIILPTLIVINLIAKVPFGVATLTGTQVILFYLWLKEGRIFHLKIALLNTIFAVIAYLLFLSPHTWEQRHFEIAWNFPKMLTTLRIAPLIQLTIVIVAFLAIFIGVSRINFRTLKESQRVLVLFLLSSSTLGVLRFVLWGNSAEEYFMNFSLLCASLLTGIGVAEYFYQRHSKLDKQTCVIILLLTGMSLIVMMSGPNIRSNISTVSWKVLALLIVWTCTLLVTFWRRLFDSRRSRSPKDIFILSTLSVSIAMFLSGATAMNSYSNHEVTESTELTAFTWLKSSSPPDAIVATNRFLCAIPSSCQFDDSSYLISAVARRRMYVEGPRFVIGGLPYPQWMTDRIVLSTRFADKPNEKDLRKLKDFGVSWFVVSEQFLPTGSLVESSWTKFGVIRYHENGIAIIELRS